MALKFGGASYIRENGNIVGLSVYVRRETAAGTRTFLVNYPCTSKFLNKAAALAALTQYAIDNGLPAYFAARDTELADVSDLIPGADETL